jgi:hypothetical protein
MNTNVTVVGAGVAADPAVKPIQPTPHKPQDHGQLEPIEPPPHKPRPVLPMLLRANGLTLNLPYDEALERYGLWKIKIIKNCYVRGKLLQPGDTAEVDGAVVQQLVGSGWASVDDPRMAEEADIINKAAAMGLPQKIREIAAFAPPKKAPWVTRPRDSEASE